MRKSVLLSFKSLAQREPYFGVCVNPSMNPSGVQLRRCAILGAAHHTYPEALVDHLRCWHWRGLGKLASKVFLSFLGIVVELRICKQHHLSMSILLVSRRASHG